MKKKGINMSKKKECDCCMKEFDKIHRKLVITDGDGFVQDSYEWCQECWEDMEKHLNRIL